ncbi:DUF6851 domain-containing protein [Novipirellula sp.]|uniref:DUF6851 domain-containing protein n=1 Tax=Novipirellula sp. TaxID=2795430 RepID=UPI0035658D21
MNRKQTRYVHRQPRYQSLEERRLLAVGLQSPYQPLDVNIDLAVDAQDARDVIGILQTGHAAADVSINATGMFADVSGDNHVTPLDALRIINHLDRQSPTIAAKLIHDSGGDGVQRYDLVTQELGLHVRTRGINELQVLINDLAISQFRMVDHGEDFLLTSSMIESALGAPLSDGVQTIELRDRESEFRCAFEVVLDRTSPQPIFYAADPVYQQQGTRLVIGFDEPIRSGVPLSADNIRVQRADSEHVIEIKAVRELASDRLAIEFNEAIANGLYKIKFIESLQDVAGNQLTNPLPTIEVDRYFTFDVDPSSQLVTVEAVAPTISVQWDRAVQNAVIETSPGPTVASRAYGILHTVIYDAWSAYDPRAISTTIRDQLQRPDDENTLENKRVAISYAAHSVLVDLFPTQRERFDLLMHQLGLDPSADPNNATTAVGIGRRMAAELLAVRHEDGSNQLGNSVDGAVGVPYSDVSGYVAANQAGISSIVDRWTPEFVPIDVSPVQADHLRTQQYLTPHWGAVAPFAVADLDSLRPPPPEPFLLVDGTVDMSSKTITLEDGQVLAISRALIGTVINPKFIQQAEDLVEISSQLTDQQKLIAEFWEDGGNTSFPPGTWMTFGQFVSARDRHTLDQDVAMFFALGNAVMDAGIATWEAKRFYDYARPVRAIRSLGHLGLIGDFDVDRQVWVIDAWNPGEGTQRQPATDFLTYQSPGSDPSPPFAEYTSGHSSFSAAGATILELFTGSETFGATISLPAGSSRFEPEVVPDEATTLSWQTFRQAANEAGVSRIYGGIHFADGDLQGRQLGDRVGRVVWDRVQALLHGGAE